MAPWILTLELHGGEWSASRLGRFTPRKRAPGTHWIGWCLGPRVSLIFLVDPPSSVVVWYRHFGGICCLHLQGWSEVKMEVVRTAQQPRNPRILHYILFLEGCDYNCFLWSIIFIENFFTVLFYNSFQKCRYNLCIIRKETLHWCSYVHKYLPTLFHQFSNIRPSEDDLRTWSYVLRVSNFNFLWGGFTSLVFVSF